MNANELADALQETEPYYSTDYKLFDKAATMLRQQQTELDAFKLQYYNTGYSLQLRDKDETIRQQQAEIEALKEFAIWMTGCGYDFCKHDYFIKCRDELLVGKSQEK